MPHLLVMPSSPKIRAKLSRSPATSPSRKKSFSAVKTILYLFRAHHRGRCRFVPWRKVYLQPEEYTELFERLKEDEHLWGFVQNNLRYDYYSRQNFVIRMLSPTHELFLARVNGAILEQLLSIRNGVPGAVREFAERVQPHGSTTLFFKSDPTKDVLDCEHTPDAEYGCPDEKYPAVIFEISFSQKRKDLPKLARDYILGSEASVQVVIGLDIEYRATRKATVSMWRPRWFVRDDGGKNLMAEQTVVEEPFRNEDGTAAEGRLSLRLKDFTAFPEDHDDMLDNPTLTISYETLVHFLERAEDRQQQQRQGGGKRKRLQAGDGVIMPPNQISSSPEEILSEDELEFQQREERARLLSEQNDRDFEGRQQEMSGGDWSQRLRRR